MKYIMKNKLDGSDVVTWCSDSDFEYNAVVGSLVHIKIDPFHELIVIIVFVHDDYMQICLASNNDLMDIKFDEIMDMDLLIDHLHMKMAQDTLWRLSRICHEKQIETPFERP